MTSSSAEVDQEFLEFLSSSARYDLKFLAIKHCAGLSKDVPGRQFIVSKQVYVDRIMELACDNVTNVVRESITCLINIAGDGIGVERILASRESEQFLDMVLSSVVLKGCILADALAMLLSNISREAEGSRRLIKLLLQDDPPATFDQLIQVMCLVEYNANADLNFLAPFLANLSQVETARKHFLDKEKCVIQRLLPFTSHASEIRRQAISTILKNCCFEYGYHDWLLGSSVDILPCLLLPLAGPEEFDEDDTEKLPVELQYLEPNKSREPVAIVRANLVEALTQLCTTAEGRKNLRGRNTYIIIREYHKWEAETTIHPMIMNLIDILIGDEPSAEVGSNLKEISVPGHLQEQFNKAKQAELDQITMSSPASDTVNHPV
ncbi:protein HGH1 homolog [Watersipora subatra]|uniref:protein HGH1 homolog n=1 Tax=Watersipora subatra TaxID=2589382 RepID=UPI00355ADCC4